MNKKEIRKSVGLPDEDIFDTKKAVREKMPCENTFSYAPPAKNGYKSLNAISRLAPADNNTKFKDYGASGGSTSPNTEVNAENQGVASEVGGTAQCKYQPSDKPTKTQKRP